MVLEKNNIKIEPVLLQINQFLGYFRYMNKNELLAALAERDIHPSKKLGQNFLIDGNMLQFIFNHANPLDNEAIIEIGPGMGVLTELLVRSGAQVTAIEFDSRLSQYLREKISAHNFKLVEFDACKVDYENLVKELGRYRIVANLPYSISTPLIAGFTELKNPPSDMLFLLQKETAQRFAAGIETKNYGAISVKIQVLYDVKYIRTIPPSVFFPMPDVESALVSFKLKKNYPDFETRKSLNVLLKIAFSQRRKKLINNISPEYAKYSLSSIFEDLNIDANTRPENISPDRYLELLKKLS